MHIALGAGRQGIVDLSYLIDNHTQCPTVTFVSIRHVLAQFRTQIIPNRHTVTFVSPDINQQQKITQVTYGVPTIVRARAVLVSINFATPKSPIFRW